MKNRSFTICLFLIYNSVSGQNLSARISAQLDFQKADFRNIFFPFDFKEHSTTTLNFGADILAEKKIKDKFNAYFGIGYYRNKFTFRRAYDHRLLNTGTDSIPIGTSTHNYTFHLLRCPIGIYYQLLKIGKYEFSFSLENIVNFSFKHVYNGTKPFPHANDKYPKFQYFGNSVFSL